MVPLASLTFGNKSEIDARLEANGPWKTIATVYSVAGADAEDIANQIINAMTFRHQAQPVLHEVDAFLKALLDADGLSRKAAHETLTFLVRIQSASVE